MRVLVACEREGRVRDAFRLRGHDAWSCDLEPGEGEFRRAHLQMDALQALKWADWDLLIAHPPCTFLANSGVRWLLDNPKRYRAMLDGAQFFNMLRDADIPRVCIENPIPHKYARAEIGAYSQIIQPWQFGHNESKATCLWLRGLPKLVPTRIMPGPHVQRVWRLGPSPTRQRERSKTYFGIAEAMAAQWGQS